MDGSGCETVVKFRDVCGGFRASCGRIGYSKRMDALFKLLGILLIGYIAVSLHTGSIFAKSGPRGGLTIATKSRALSGRPSSSTVCSRWRSSFTS